MFLYSERGLLKRDDANKFRLCSTSLLVTKKILSRIQQRFAAFNADMKTKCVFSIEEQLDFPEKL